MSLNVSRQGLLGCAWVLVCVSIITVSTVLAISTTVNVITNNSHFVNPNKDIKNSVKLNWCNVDVGCYTNTVRELLSATDIPTDTLLCRANCAVDDAARLEKYYSDIKCCLLTAASRRITTVKLVFINIGGRLK